MRAILLGGHRGSGETDRASLPAADRRKAPENTLASLAEALQAGAGAVEIDAMLTRYGQVAVTHSNAIAAHIHPEDRAKLDIHRPFICQYDYKELRKFRIGRREEADVRKEDFIPLLADVLELVQQAPGVLLNIEIKGALGTDCPHPPGLVAAIRDALVAAAFPAGRVILSSFLPAFLEEAGALMPEVPRGMLFRPEGGKGEEFTPATIRMLHAQLMLSYVHPEIMTLTEEALQVAAERRLGVNVWSFNEPLPQERPEPILRAVRLCGEYALPLGIFTNYLQEMREIL